MTKNNQNSFVSQFLIITVILYSIVPIVSNFFSRYLTTYAYMVLCLATFLSMVFAEGFNSIEKYGSVYLPFIIYQLLLFTNKSSGIVMWGYSALLFFMPLALGYFLFYEQGVFLREKAFKAVRFSIVITVITTIIGCIRNPMAARILATIETSQDERNISFGWQNIGGYGFVYTVVLLYPLLIYAYKQNRLKWFFFYPLAVSTFALVILSEYATALLLLIISSMFIFISKKLSLRGMIVFGAFAVVFILLFQGVINNLLRSLADIVDSEILSERLITLAGGKTALEKSDNERIWLYRYSFNTFLSSPLFGTMFGKYGRIGGHSSILDTLAKYGLVGLAVLYFMYRKIYIVFIKPYSNHPGYGFIVWTFIQAIFLSTINTGFWFDVLALYMPLILFAIGEKTDINYFYKKQGD